MVELYFGIKWLRSSLTIYISTDLLSGSEPQIKSKFKTSGSQIKLKTLPCNIQNQLVMTSVASISKGQPYPYVPTLIQYVYLSAIVFDTIVKSKFTSRNLSKRLN